MEMLGMQADMQLKSHFPGCYTPWDLNLDANGTIRPACNVDRILWSRLHYNVTLPLSSDFNMFYNRNFLKQTMLKHEAEFRDQIDQLHRLYRRQKELMDEMKKIDLYEHHCSLLTLQPNCVLSPKSSNYEQVPQHTATSTNLAHCQPPISEAKGSVSPLHSSDGNIGQAGLDPTCIESSSKTSEIMESHCKKFGKKILDLELPADEYFHREELFISGSGCNSVFPKVNCIPSSISSKKKVMADLNIPVKLEEDVIPEFSDFQDRVIGHRETSLQDPSGKSNSNFHVPSKGQIMRDPEARFESLLLDKHKMQRECVPCNDKAGQGRNDLNSFPQDFYTEKLSIEHVNDDQAQDCAIPHGLDGTDVKLCNENLQHVAREVSANNYKPVATSNMCSSYQIVPLDGGMNFKQSSIAVQALPCFKGKSSKSFTISPGLAGNELCLGKTLLSGPKFCGASFPQASWQNDFLLDGQPPSISSVSFDCKNDNDSALEHSPVKYTKDFKYVRPVKSLDLNFVSTNVAGSQDASHIHSENKLQNSTSCSPQIFERPVHGTKSGERRVPSIPLESARDQANSLCVHDAEFEKVESSNSLGFKSTLGFHMYNKPPIGQCTSDASPFRNHPNSFAKEDIKDKEEERIPDINLEFSHVPNRGRQLAKTGSVAESEPCHKNPGYGVIDLNSCLSMDESLLMPSHSMEINLEPPASPENKECSPPRGESDEIQLETPLLSLGQENGDLQEALVRNAVEAIVSISSSEIQACLDSATGKPFKASNSLYWFARVASSVVDEPGSEFGVTIGVKDYGDNEEYLSDEIDYFEAMTLNLTEIKVEDSWCKSNGRKEEESSIIFSTNQPKRGRTRRGRQLRKDFQSEVLPSLASLSGYEVTEDLHMIGGLMEAAGSQWEIGSSRNAGRNGYTKGRRRSSFCASDVTERTMNMLLKQQSGNNEVGIQQRRLIEWGKVTRRPRGPRYPSSKPRLIVGQV